MGSSPFIEELFMGLDKRVATLAVTPLTLGDVAELRKLQERIDRIIAKTEAREMSR